MNPKANKRRRRRRSPTLRFSPYAWAKLLFLRDRRPNEVGGFGLTTSQDLLFVHDIRLVRQQVSSVSVRFDDMAVADFFDEQVDNGLAPEEFGRIWLHTHPGNSAFPSLTDEETFGRCFGHSDWAVMAILAAEGDTYARIQFNVGPRAGVEIPMEIDYQKEFQQTDRARWAEEYERCVFSEPIPVLSKEANLDFAPASEAGSQFLDSLGEWTEFYAMEALDDFGS